MFKVTKYPHGTFSWADCSSTDAAKAKPFYAELMGWEIDDQPMGDGQFYTMYKCEGETVAGLSQMPPQMMEMGVPSMWNSYVTVEDLDAAVSQVKPLGGLVAMDAIDVFEAGRMAFVQDPTGANVALWQAKRHIGSGLVNTPGAMTWNELTTTDNEKARAFYGNLLGWEFQKLDGMEYYLIQNRGRSNGGIMTKTADMGDMPPHWAVYFAVADIDESVKKAKALGGTTTDIMDAPGVGRFAVINDPAGAAVALIQSEAPQPWVE